MRARQVGAARLLLERSDADVRETTAGGETLLMLAAKQNDEAMLRELLLLDAPPHAVDTDGRSALFWAAASNAERCVTALLQADVNGALADNDQRTPLMIACANGCESAVAALLQGGNSERVALTETDSCNKSALLLLLDPDSDCMLGESAGGDTDSTDDWLSRVEGDSISGPLLKLSLSCKCGHVECA